MIACTSVVILAAASPLTNTNAPETDIRVMEADGYRSIIPVHPEKKPTAKLPLAVQLGFDFIPVPAFSLPALNNQALLSENEMEVKSGEPLRYGVPRALEIFPEDGQWVDVPGGRLWQIEIKSLGAENSRIMIENMDLPKGAELRMYSPDFPQDVAGPFTDDGPFDTGQVWSGTYTTEGVMIEYFEHIRTPKQEGLPFVISEMVHGFLPILKQGGGLASGAGSCHNHPACYAAWADIADAAAVVLFSGGYVCSGQLTATTDADETPYFTTANHCISSQSSANSAQFYFFYERTSCTGSYSNGTVASGADLVATYSSSDNTLLMIRGAIPNGVFFAGWTTSNPPSGEDITSVHFPQGDYMRISFGDVISSGICGSSTNWAGTSWSDGVTEPGSSGAAVYRNSDQKLFGVLTCGASSCSNQAGDDGYGRFSRAYSGAFSPHMAAGSDDGYEPNGDCSSATQLGNGTYSNLVVKSVDEDHYAITVPSGSTLSVTVDFSHSNGDIDAELLSGCGGNVLASGSSNSNDENLSWTNSGSETDVILRVFLYSDTRNDYNLYLSGSGGGGGDPTGACCVGTSCSVTTAASCSAAGGTYNGDGSTCAEVNCDGGGGGGNCKDEWTADCQGTCFPDYVYEAWQGDGYCDDGAYVPYDYGCTECPPGVPIYMNCDEFNCDNGDCTGCDGGGGDQTGACCVGTSCSITTATDCSTAGGTYNGDGSTCAEANCDGGGGGGDGCDGATGVGEGAYSFDTTGSTTNVDLTGYCDPGDFGDDVTYNAIFFAYTASDSGTATASTCNAATFDTRLSAHAGDCEPSSVITCLDDTDGCSGFTTEISWEVVGGATYYIAVGGYSAGDAGSGTLTISLGGGGGGGGNCPDGEIEDCNGNCAPETWVGDGYCDDGTYEWNGVAIYFNCKEFDCDNGDCTGCDGGGGGGNCPDGEIEDCNGNCAPEGWVGDGYCDDGTWEWNGVPIYLNCDEFNCDNGDCTGCDGGGGGTGACCVDTTCSEQTAADCAAAGGSFYGEGSSCNDVDCGGGGECPTDWTADCKGTCFPNYVYEAWQGDGYCDDGAYVPYDYGCTECPPGVPIYMNCDEFNCDNGDCTGCDGGGGGGECDPTVVVVGDNAVDTSGSVGVTLDLTGYCDPGEFGTDAFLNTSFYEFTAPASDTYTISTCNQAGWDTRLSVHLGDCAPENVITCLDDTEGCELYTTTIEFTAKAGALYVIALGGYSAGDYGPATLTIDGDDGGNQLGACCFENGVNCQNNMTFAQCLQMPDFHGWHAGVTCGAPPYEICQTGGATGACCVAAPVNCHPEVTQTYCDTVNGEWKGANSSCSECDSSNGCLGDLNGDEIINGSDLTILLGSWGELAGGDLNGDGATNGADLTILLGGWGPC